ncbi:hypothetical protein JQR88_03010 [Pseudomonas luteola]|uniref:hypothetical protein n=1 Tax=Pseudomonas luteola TaxID=47886 RepID=UPI003DA017FF
MISAVVHAGEAAMKQSADRRCARADYFRLEGASGRDLFRTGAAGTQSVGDEKLVDVVREFHGGYSSRRQVTEASSQYQAGLAAQKFRWQP